MASRYNFPSRVSRRHQHRHGIHDSAFDHFEPPVLGFITLPSRLIESTIAASVIVAALNNLYPLIEKRLWVVAFVFGLVHGLGFANVLTDLGLPKSALWRYRWSASILVSRRGNW